MSVHDGTVSLEVWMSVHDRIYASLEVWMSVHDRIC